VAAAFGKRHRDVLEAIRDLCSQLPEDRRTNFRQTVEMRENPSGGAMIPSTSYRITRDGFTWLAMRLRGKKELECRDSVRRGSFHGHGLNQRKQEKQVLESELSALIAQAQPGLLN
jgi:hypothetical protein